MPPAPQRRDRLLLLPYIGNSVTKIQKYLIQHLARPWLSPQKHPQSELFPYPTQGNISPTQAAPTAACRTTESHSKGYEPILVTAPTYIGQRTNLYWSAHEPILVATPTYIGQPDDQYRFKSSSPWGGSSTAQKKRENTQTKTLQSMPYDSSW